MLNSGPPPSPFPSSLVADPAQEAVEKVGRDFLKALDWMPSDEGAVPKSKATLVELS
jgi:hypothetical protein